MGMGWEGVTKIVKKFFEVPDVPEVQEVQEVQEVFVTLINTSHFWSL